MVVEFDVRDRRETPVKDMKDTEVELRQDGLAQAILSMRAAGPPGRYVVRYVPRSGLPGPLMLRVLRPGTLATGPDGGALKIRVEPVLTALEHRLTPLLADPAPSGLTHRTSVLRFEKDGDALHHTFVVEVPLGPIALATAGEAARGSIGLLAQVTKEDGELVRRFSLEYPLETQAGRVERLRSERVVWTSHLHLPAGRYVVETAVADLGGTGTGAGRLAFEAPAAAPGLRLSSVSVLAEGGALSSDEAADHNPLRHRDSQLIPDQRRRLLAGTDEPLPFYVIVYPDASRAEPLEAALELYRSGSLIGRGAIALPAGSGSIPYLGSFPVARLPAGAYEIKVVIRQGTAMAIEAAAFELIDPARQP